MKRFSILPLFLIALFSVPALGQDIILLNQDGEKVGVAKGVDEKAPVKKGVVEAKPDTDVENSKIENGIVTIVKPDGTVQQFKLSEANSVTITRSSKSVVGEDGVQKMESTGKAILIGPDGIRREIDLGSGGLSGSAAKTQAPKTWMIGVSCSPVSPVLRSQLNLEKDLGLVITRVLQGGAAEDGGFQANDILMYGDQTPIGSRKDLSNVVNEAGAANVDVVFKLLRRGEEISVTVTPKEREGMNQMMMELGPRRGGFGMDFPDFGAGMDLEFKQFGPGIIIGRGDGIEADAFMGTVEERMQRIRKEIEEMRLRMRDGGR